MQHKEPRVSRLLQAVFDTVTDDDVRAALAWLDVVRLVVDATDADAPLEHRESSEAARHEARGERPEPAQVAQALDAQLAASEARVAALEGALRVLCGSHPDDSVRQHANEEGWYTVRAKDVLAGREALAAPRTRDYERTLVPARPREAPREWEQRNASTASETASEDVTRPEDVPERREHELLRIDGIPADSYPFLPTDRTVDVHVRHCRRCGASCDRLRLHFGEQPPEVNVFCEYLCSACA